MAVQRAESTSYPVPVRLSPLERQRMVSAAKLVGLSVSAFIRLAIVAKAENTAFAVVLRRFRETVSTKSTAATCYLRRRERFLAAFVEKVDRRVVYEIHRGVCGICRLAVSWEEFAMDHVIPLAKGGAHSYANTQVAHRRCNSLKGVRILNG